MAEDTSAKAAYQVSPKGVRRVGANADWPGGAHNFNIFGIYQGCIKVTALFGHVRVGCTGALLVPVLAFTPTGGGALSNICTLAAGAIWPINTVLAWSGLLAGILTPTVGIGHGDAATATEGFNGGYLTFVPGIISVINATADATAQIDWYIRYEPASPEAWVAPL
jgi:hypothetical protein